MAPYYQQICEELGWKIDTALLEKMQKGWEPCLLIFSTFCDLFFFFPLANAEQLKKFADQLEDAEVNAGETEIREALFARAEYLSKIGDKASLCLLE